MRSLVLFCDGASRGNPGPGAYGFAVFENGTVIHEQSETIGVVTNNMAEYQGLLMGLKKCLELKASHLTVKSDSELLVRQLNGQYKIRSPNLIPLFEEAKKLLRSFQSTHVLHVRREENKLADSLANEALDRP